MFILSARIMVIKCVIPDKITVAEIICLSVFLYEDHYILIILIYEFGANRNVRSAYYKILIFFIQF